ncbi:class I SAM-dependent methyltransferase [Actinophytocola sp. NPDC049390]|uniref:class I SAM-dependent methyltransferase n=1 Tax=Actinophytocola sp. NPDC049390 TaxID=3363894 RepID=UPI0037AA923E
MSQGFRLDEVDFDGVYEGRSLVSGRDLRFEIAPWDIGAPQPAVVALADAGELTGRVLDAGCGLGENAIFLAGRGLRVTGVDGAAAAVRAARERAEDKGVEAEFVHADVTSFEGVEQRFDTVLDSALYHCLDDAQRTAYAEALWRVTTPGARLHVLCFADVGNDGLGLPMHVSQDDLRAHLSERWRIVGIESGDYVTALTQAMFEGLGDRLREAGLSVDPDKVRTDEQGRLLAAVWHLTAERRP